jgi:hypothetical protein
MKIYTVTELSDKVREYPEGVVISGVMYRGLGLSRLMSLVIDLTDTELQAITTFCRTLTIAQQQTAIESWVCLSGPGWNPEKS